MQPYGDTHLTMTSLDVTERFNEVGGTTGEALKGIYAVFCKQYPDITAEERYMMVLDHWVAIAEKAENS